MRNILIIGGTRFVGPPLIDQLLRIGDKVTVFCRGTDYGAQFDTRVQVINGDREVPTDLEKISFQKYELVYDMCCFSQEHAGSLLKALDGRFDHIVFFSTAAVYAEPLFFPIVESAELGEWPSFGDYGTRKAESENAYILYARENNKKVTVFRPTYLLGENNYFDRENYYFSRILKNAPILIPGTGKALIQFAFLDEVVDAFLLCPQSQVEQVEVLNIGGDEYISVENFVNLCGRIADRKPILIYANMEKHQLDERRFYDDLYPFPNVSLILDNEKIKKKYDIQFESLHDGLSDIYIRWKQSWTGEIRRSHQEQNILDAILG